MIPAFFALHVILSLDIIQQIALDLVEKITKKAIV